MNPNKQLRLTQRIKKNAQREKWVHFLLFGISMVSTFTIAAIIITLISESIPFLAQISLKEFFLHDQWSPLFEPPQFGIRPLIAGTLTTTLVASLVALPLGLLLAAFLSEFASPQLRETCKPILEILAGIPTVVFGYFALIVLSPFLQTFIPSLGGFSLLAAGLVMGIMIIPYVISLSEDALQAINPDLREASFALGASRVQTTFRVVFPAASSGLYAAVTLAISRALGETMIVAIAAGMLPQWTFNPLEQGQTLTAFIVQVSLGDAPQGTLAYQSLFVAGLVLFIMTVFLNIIGFILKRRSLNQK